MKPRDPNNCDRYVAGKLRLAREQIGLSQVGVSKALGVSFQQLQKYESGESRIAVGRFYQLVQLYERPIDWFFDGLAGSVVD